MKYLLSLALCVVASLAVAGEPFRFERMSAKREAVYRSLVPDGIFTADEMKRAIFYDKDTVYPAFQFNGGFYSTKHKLNSDVAVPDANNERPWITGGLDDSPDGGDFKIYIPAGPIKGYTDNLPVTASLVNNSYFTVGSDKTSQFVGEHSVGSKSVEVLVVKRENGWHVFEVRVLEKAKRGNIFAEDNWKVKWYRPLKNRADLLQVVKGDAYESLLLAHYKKPLATDVFADRHDGHDGDRGLRGTQVSTVLNLHGVKDELPEMPTSLLSKVLQRPFADVTNKVWAEAADGVVCFAGEGGPFPKKFKGGMFSSKSCLACHATALKDESEFGFARDWYGRVRGTDGVFSFPIHDDSCVSHTGYHLPPVWNRQLVKAGLLVVVGR